MPRTNLPTTAFLVDSATSLLDPAGTAVDQANGMNVALQATGGSAVSDVIPAGPSAKNLILRVANTAVAVQNAIIRAGVNPPAQRALLGDLTVPVTNATTRWIGPLSSSRFTQADGSLNVDFSVGFTGTITAFVVPERAGV